jgi:serine/threonine-protein kinase HipA
MSALEVYCSERLAGTLEDTQEGLRFRYDDRWATTRPPISQSLPLGRELSAEAAHAFFSGLLPEGHPRRMLARRLGISERNDFAMLAALGGDCPGAISLFEPGTFLPRRPTGDDVKWLSEAELEDLIETLPERPMLAGEDGEIRLSLAGAQDKLPVVVDSGGRVGLTTGRTPSTHIMKTPIRGFEGTVVNEAFCLALGRRLELTTVFAVPRRAGAAHCLLVERYDRAPGEAGVERLHQEDFCQAMGIPPERKYQAEGGPSIEDCFRLVRTATSVPARHLLRLLDAVALSFVVGNHDAHGKNFSLLYRSDAVDLAPFYDILCTVAYPGLARKMAMKLGGEYRSDYVEARHLDRMLDVAGLGPAPAREHLAQFAEETPAVALDVRRALAEEGWDHPILDTVMEVVERRAEHLRRIAREPRSRPA